MQPSQQQQQQGQDQSPFSPLQTGCAFVMLTNMLIYLAVVAFVFNLLDPSKLDADYLAGRGFTVRPERESEEDVEFRRLSEQRRKDVQDTQGGEAGPVAAKPDVLETRSPAARLSELGGRSLATSRPEEPSKPKAALTEGPAGSVYISSVGRGTSRSGGSRGSGGSSVRSAQSRLYSVSIYQQAGMPSTYAPLRPEVFGPMIMERYEPLPVELASGIYFPSFSLPSADSSGAYLYTPPAPVSDPVRGGLKVSAPPAGTEMFYTNYLRKAEDPPEPAKDAL